MRVRTDGVNASARAGITSGRTPESRRSLWGGIVDLIARAFAAILEGVIQTDPVTSLMGEGLISRTDVREWAGARKNQLKTHPTQVKRNLGATGNGGIEDNNTVVLWVAGVVERESSVSEKSFPRISSRCDVLVSLIKVPIN